MFPRVLETVLVVVGEGLGSPPHTALLYILVILTTMRLGLGLRQGKVDSTALFVLFGGLELTQSLVAPT
jgi:hypothetical protein